MLVRFVQAVWISAGGWLGNLLITTSGGSMGQKPEGGSSECR